MRLIPAQLGALALRVSLLGSLFVLVACGSRPQQAKSPPNAPPVRVIRTVWHRFSEARAWPAASEPFSNRGHRGAGALAVVHVNPEARETYTHLVRDSALPDGSVVALFHFEADHRPSAIYVMQKDAGAWRFLALDAEGRELPQAALRGQATQTCPGCHADAVADSLFGLPR